MAARLAALLVLASLAANDGTPSDGAFLDLVHDYDFTAGSGTRVPDGVGDCAATIWGGAALAGGAGLKLDGVDDYVEFPEACFGATIGAGVFIVVEACYRDAACGGRTSRVWDFGRGPGESASLALDGACAASLEIESRDGRGAASYAAPGGGGTVRCIEAAFFNSSTPAGRVHDAPTNATAAACAGGAAACRRVPADLGPCSANYVGRSQYAGDAFLNATVSRLRVFSRPSPTAAPTASPAPSRWSPSPAPSITPTRSPAPTATAAPTGGRGGGRGSDRNDGAEVEVPLVVVLGLAVTLLIKLACYGCRRYDCCCGHDSEEEKELKAQRRAHSASFWGKQTFSFSPDHAWSEKREPGRGTLGNLRLVFMAHVRPSALKMSVWQGVKNAKQGIKQTIRAGRGGFSFRAKSPPKGAGRQVQVQPKGEEKRPDDKLDERRAPAVITVASPSPERREFLESRFQTWHRPPGGAAVHPS